ncbi:antibiotic biosynthesis monooxygenase [Sphingomonas alpina]|uniref:Antibiotic biosynthesis monooxygenase n=2 Tax=Sphingomonas alpina TaxID=653931 RepID=A0A7H0LQV5_9SPHN|nr:antibiotic biosynthesis monooxygenase [Sphingomonas alpina]
MIARIWKGAVPTIRAADYLDLMRSVSLPDYRAVEGNAGAWCLHQQDGDLTQITMLTFWTDMAAISRFAGSDPAVAKYYPFDPDFLIEMTPGVEHLEILQA